MFHHAEPNYLMLVRWISETTNSLPHNASHRVGIGAFVMNTNREVLSKFMLFVCDLKKNTISKSWGPFCNYIVEVSPLFWVDAFLVGSQFSL